MHKSRSKNFLMGISGGFGSGKSTIVNEVIEKIGPEKKYLYSTTMLITGIDRN